jgi:hypothetical protein
MLKGASIYSRSCNPVNKEAKTNVKISARTACRFARTIIAWCAQVTVAPELNKKKVLVKGIPEVLIGLIASGGHTPPILKTGAKLEWKNAQKKRKEKHNF